MANTAGGKALSAAEKLGLAKGMVVQELGWDDDVDDDLRIAIEDSVDGEMVEEAMEAVDVVLLWWRDDDGDLVDGLVDSLTDLSNNGVVWLMTPKVGRQGHVDPADVSEAAITAGLSQTSNTSVSQDWTATKLVRPKGNRR
ncbi:DUF3052 domain-containing protein [Ammonicoccus fulvus]|uniref:DUF3052 domain-containing protein n=1 Tax=Ammonicoccus fulvus TaxID=3138240 RepID=A0ABZ3FTN5_9ACTN